jgi:hypothetical protein
MLVLCRCGQWMSHRLWYVLRRLRKRADDGSLVRPQKSPLKVRKISIIFRTKDLTNLICAWAREWSFPCFVFGWSCAGQSPSASECFPQDWIVWLLGDATLASLVEKAQVEFDHRQEPLLWVFLFSWVDEVVWMGLKCRRERGHCFIS